MHSRDKVQLTGMHDRQELASAPQDSKNMLGYQGLTNAYRLLNQDKAFLEEI